MCSRAKPFRLELHNDGTQPAEGIIVYLYGNSNASVLGSLDLLHQSLPISVTLVRSVRNLIDLAARLADNANALDHLATSPAFLPYYDSLHYLDEPFPIHPGLQYVQPPMEFSYRKGSFRVDLRDPLRHNFSISLARSHDYARDFVVGNLKEGEEDAVEYAIHANNLPEPARGTLRVRGVAASAATEEE